MFKNPYSAKNLWVLGIIASLLLFETFGEAIYMATADPAKAPMVKLAILVATAVFGLFYLSSWFRALAVRKAERRQKRLSAWAQALILVAVLDFPVFFGLAWFSHPRPFFAVTIPLLLAASRFLAVQTEKSKAWLLPLSLWGTLLGATTFLQMHEINRKYFAHAVASHRPAIPEWLKAADALILIPVVGLVLLWTVAARKETARQSAEVDELCEQAERLLAELRAQGVAIQRNGDAEGSID